jgi:hypothetical protein
VSGERWSRISDDLAATTGRRLELLADAGTGAFIEVHVFLDGEPHGGFGRSLAADPEAQLAEVADLLREHTLDEAVWGGWPICPDHHTHPLDPCLDPDGLASWRCPRGRFIARIGDLPPSDRS